MKEECQEKKRMEEKKEEGIREGRIKENSDIRKEGWRKTRRDD